jgi:NADH-quinone oxidoreductase subunit H
MFTIFALIQIFNLVVEGEQFTTGIFRVICLIMRYLLSIILSTDLSFLSAIWTTLFSSIISSTNLSFLSTILTRIFITPYFFKLKNLSDIKAKIDTIMSIPQYSRPIICLLIMLSSACFESLFGSSLLVILFGRQMNLFENCTLKAFSRYAIETFLEYYCPGEVTMITLIKILIIIVPLLISIAYFTLAERKILAAIQRRRGPNVVGIYGLLQPLADGLKLFVKEMVMPSSANKFIFLLSPILTFTICLMGWAVITYDKYAVLADLDVGLLYLLGVSSLGVYGIIMAGWASNSKYAFLGGLRSAAQMVSYEVSLGLIVVTIVLSSGSFCLGEIVEAQRDMWYVISFFPLFVVFFTSGLAETNRHPFDLPEAEAELVSGYNVEYSAMGFALFSLGEYGNMLLMSSLNVTLFFGGWLPPLNLLSFIPGSFWFGIKVCFFVVLYVWVRAALPRYRYDQLMNLGWKVFFPVSLTYLVLTYYSLSILDILPF